VTFPSLLIEVADSRFLTPLMSDDDENDEIPTNPKATIYITHYFLKKYI
jgi:hypothetical protein